MRSVSPAVALVALTPLLGLLVLNWRGQLQTQRKLDEMAVWLASRPAEPMPPTPAEPKHVEPKPEAKAAEVKPTLPAVPAEPNPLPTVITASGTVPRELDRIVTPPAPAIEATDLLVIEASIKDQRTNKVDRLPLQPVGNEFVVRPDGTVWLSTWGQVSVAGQTPEKAGEAIRRKLIEKVPVGVSGAPSCDVHVTVEVKSANSKRYYIVMETEGIGEQVLAFPLSGSTTVLDAIAGVSGLSDIAAKRTIRLARKGVAGAADQILLVDWFAIVQRGDTRTNYQLVAGDRVFVTGR